MICLIASMSAKRLKHLMQNTYRTMLERFRYEVSVCLTCNAYMQLLPQS
jgi:hypothetical protein